MVSLASVIRLSACFIFLIIVPAQSSEEYHYNYQHELLNTPVYDPASKSYFEMVDGSHGLVTGYNAYEGPTWAQAEALAKQREYGGVHGRLAIVSDPETHGFLMRTFRPQTRVWIGVRYWCATRRLQDSSGKYLDKTAFAPWAKNWRGGDFICQIDPATHLPIPTDYMPVAYTSLPEGFQWVGLGVNKRFYYFFVEYPTGKP